MINKCGVTGELLGPPNYHRYNQMVQQHYAAKVVADALRGVPSQDRDRPRPRGREPVAGEDEEGHPLHLEGRPSPRARRRPPSTASRRPARTCWTTARDSVVKAGRERALPRQGPGHDAPRRDPHGHRGRLRAPAAGSRSTPRTSFAAGCAASISRSSRRARRASRTSAPSSASSASRARCSPRASAT